MRRRLFTPFAGGTPPECLRTLPDQALGRPFAGGTPLFVLAMVLGLAMAAWA